MESRSLISFQNTDGFLKVGLVIIIYVILVLYLTLLFWLRCRFFSKEKGVEKISFVDILFFNLDLMSIVVFLLVLISMCGLYFENDIFMLLLFLVVVYMLPGSLPQTRIPGGKIATYLFSGFLLLIFLIFNIFKKGMINYRGVIKGFLYFFTFLFFSISVLLF